jgi:hypothetical protein
VKWLDASIFTFFIVVFFSETPPFFYYHFYRHFFQHFSVPALNLFTMLIIMIIQLPRGELMNPPSSCLVSRDLIHWFR